MFNKSLFRFFLAVNGTVSASSESSSDGQTGKIIGAVIGAVLVTMITAMLIIACFLYQRKRWALRARGSKENFGLYNMFVSEK